MLFGGIHEVPIDYYARSRAQDAYQDERLAELAAAPRLLILPAERIRD